MARRPFGERLATGAFRLALHLYPAAFRDEYDKELTLVLLDRFRAERGAAIRAAVVIRALAGVMRDAPRVHGGLLGGVGIPRPALKLGNSHRHLTGTPS